MVSFTGRKRSKMFILGKSNLKRNTYIVYFYWNGIIYVLLCEILIWFYLDYLKKTLYKFWITLPKIVLNIAIHSFGAREVSSYESLWIREFRLYSKSNIDIYYRRVSDSIKFIEGSSRIDHKALFIFIFFVLILFVYFLDIRASLQPRKWNEKYGLQHFSL